MFCCLPEKKGRIKRTFGPNIATRRWRRPGGHLNNPFYRRAQLKIDYVGWKRKAVLVFVSEIPRSSPQDVSGLIANKIVCKTQIEILIYTL